MKKFLSILLSLFMVISAVSAMPFSALADELTTGYCGENVTYSFDSETGTLTLNGNGATPDYSYDNPSPFMNRSEIKELVITSGVTGIGEHLIEACDGLKSVSISDTVQSITAESINWCHGIPILP